MCKTCSETQIMVAEINATVAGIKDMLETFHEDDKEERTEMWKQINSLKAFRAWASGAWFTLTCITGFTAWMISQ